MMLKIETKKINWINFIMDILIFRIAMHFRDTYDKDSFFYIFASLSVITVLCIELGIVTTINKHISKFDIKAILFLISILVLIIVKM